MSVDLLCPDPRAVEYNSVFTGNFRRNAFTMLQTPDTLETVVSEPVLPRELVLLLPNNGIIIVTDNEVV